jgi:RNA polymerase sigma-70 factor (ECF subfamily)
VNVAVEDIEDQGTLRPEAHLEFALLCQAVFELPIDFRDAVLAVDVVGLHYREAAHGLGVKEATLASRVFRARERLAETLAPR